MVKAFKLPGYDKDGSQSDKDEDDEDEDGEDECSHADDFSILPAEHYECFAHSLQLVVKDGFGKAGQKYVMLQVNAAKLYHTSKSLHLRQRV